MRSLTYWQDETRSPETDRTTRRQILRDAALSFAGASLALVQVGRAEDPCRDDLAINETTALIFSEQAPLRPQVGLKDARAVWCHMPKEPARRVLLYFHGHNGYVTVDAQGRSRVPDWAAGDASARGRLLRQSTRPLSFTGWIGWVRNSRRRSRWSWSPRSARSPRVPSGPRSRPGSTPTPRG